MDVLIDLADLWTRAKQSVPETQRAWVDLTEPVALTTDSLVLVTGNEFTKDMLETKLRPHVQQALADQLGHSVTIEVLVDQARAPQIPDDLADDLADSTYSEPQIEPVAPTAAQNDTLLNPRYTFDTFVYGPSNRFAHAAAMAVAEQPARAYNPLFIYGDSGLGKTHLLHAIGHHTRRIFAGSRVHYVSSEEFTNDFINSIRDHGRADLHRRYRDVDVLLVDDIQFLSGKVQTQEEFFHTFNTLHNANKQIVITSDLPPKQLQDFEDRMRSRFEWGLITDIQPPDLETRIAILRKKTMQERREISDEVLEFIATKITANIRELEGALIRISAFASLNSSPISVELAEIVLKDLIPHETARDVTADQIKTQAADYFGVSLDDLEGPSRSKTLVSARQVAMYLCRELTDLSLPAIGAEFGNRDHTTVMHADRKIRNSIGESRRLYEQVADLTNKIRSSS
ncbi:MAG: chromosomal replication initiator protein DnaA [Candidatus Nanopelagicales bacterium]|nr:chromosomal replication initiator protein DnaA [Candidatus Nanopelagicales bacterium]MCU0295284.1 chromosomal replication initiator protein DnaA [Candidatus Nanopelagicales bacterium]MCU0297864.1 chromosomal replication initiator protein DnaA [Candidatus Nanopelagicales bacterium]